MIILLDNGIGDHFAFLMVAARILGAHPKEEFFIAAAWPEVFTADAEERPEIWLRQPPVHLMTVAEAIHNDPSLKRLCDVYRWMADNNWTGHITDAFLAMYT